MNKGIADERSRTGVEYSWLEGHMQGGLSFEMRMDYVRGAPTGVLPERIAGRYETGDGWQEFCVVRTGDQCWRDVASRARSDNPLSLLPDPVALAPHVAPASVEQLPERVPPPAWLMRGTPEANAQIAMEKSIRRHLHRVDHAREQQRNEPGAKDHDALNAEQRPDFGQLLDEARSRIYERWQARSYLIEARADAWEKGRERKESTRDRPKQHEQEREPVPIAPTIRERAARAQRRSRDMGLER